MLISIHDNNLKRVAFLDNEKPGALHYKDDQWHRYLEEATSTFDFTVLKNGNTDIQFLTEKNYVSFTYDGNDYLFNIMKTVENEKTIKCYCENLNLELLNETDPERAADGQKTFEEYLAQSEITYAQFEIGVNEISDRKRTLSWTGQSTKLERLLSIANGFDAEIEFCTKLDRDGTLKSVTLNVYKENDEDNQGVGKRQTDKVLNLNCGITSITRTIDKTGLYTAIKPIGTDGLTISSVGEKSVEKDGIKYTKSAGGTHILCPTMKDEYPSQIFDSTQDQYINLDWSYETDSADTLYSEGLAKLKKVCVPSVEYEVSGSYGLEIGDTVKVMDDKFSPVLILEVRVSEQVVSFTNPKTNKNVFSNARAIENNLSTGITSRLENIIKESQPYSAEIYASGSLTFIDGDGTVTLTPKIYKGKTEITESITDKWLKDGVDYSTDKSIVVNASNTSGMNVFKYEGYINNILVCSAQVTISNLVNGVNGQTSYIHIAYSTSSDGSENFSTTDSANKTYIGQYTDFTVLSSSNPTSYSWTLIKGSQGISVDSTGMYYQLASSIPQKPTVSEPTGWTTTEPSYVEGSAMNLYVCIKTSYSDGRFSWTDVSLSSSYDAAKQAYEKAQSAQNSADGKNTVYRQDDTPLLTGNKTGDVWFDTNDGNRIYIWTGSEWTSVQLGENAIADLSITNAKIADGTIQNAKIGNLDAGKITTGTMTANRIYGGTLSSNNYVADESGSQINLEEGTYDSVNFKIDENGVVYIRGDLYAGNLYGLITGDQIDTGTLTYKNIANGAIKEVCLEDGAVTVGKTHFTQLSDLTDGDLGVCTAGIIQSKDGNLKIDLSTNKDIQVKSDTEWTTLYIDTDGTRVKNNRTGNIVAQFTEKGTQTEKITGTIGEIGGILFQINSTESWISKV